MQTHYCSIIHFLTICAKRGARESALNKVMEKQLKSAGLIYNYYENHANMAVITSEQLSNCVIQTTTMPMPKRMIR